MERKPLLQPEFNAGGVFLQPMESDEAFINGTYDGMSYQSLLNLSLDNRYYGEVKPFMNDILYATAPSSSSSQIKQSSATFDSSTGDFAWLNKKTENPDAQKLKFPKLEPVNYDNLQLYPYNNEIFLSEPPLNYFSNGQSDGFGYHSLPDLRCLEQPNYLDFHYGDSSSLVSAGKRVVEPVPVSQVMIKLPKGRVPYGSSTTRIRRQKLSEKTRCLEKLLPWDRKMDTATMLEEAYKYVKFLQAQVSILQNMPPLVEGGGGGGSSSFSDQDRNGKTSYGSSNETKASISVFGTLARLNRQQLLQVVLNSPVAQTYLYSKGCCVYSVEQLVQYRKIIQRNALYHQTLFFSGMLS